MIKLIVILFLVILFIFNFYIFELLQSNFRIKCSLLDHGPVTYINCTNIINILCNKYSFSQTLSYLLRVMLSKSFHIELLGISDKFSHILSPLLLKNLYIFLQNHTVQIHQKTIYSSIPPKDISWKCNYIHSDKSFVAGYFYSIFYKYCDCILQE